MMPLLISFLAGLSIVIGALIIHLVSSPARIHHLSIALALGALLALLLFDLLPELRESAANIGIVLVLLLVLLGVGILKLLDLFIPDHDDTAATHDHENAVHIGIISSLALILHNLVEGMTVYSLSLTSLREGVIFAFGIALHNIPMGMLIYATMQERRRIVRRGVLAAVTLSTCLGSVLMALVSDALTASRIGALVCIAAGMIIYIVFAELLPHVLRTRPRRLSLLGSVCGFVLVLASCILGG